VYDWSFWDDFVRVATQEHGLRLIPYVCYTPKWAAKDAGENFWRSPPREPDDFGRFMTAIVSRYRHAIRSWELWNEPDNPAYWLGTAQEFAALVKSGSRAVRAADPSAQVVLGGIATELKFLETLFRHERIAPAVDIVNLHTYYETWHPAPIEELPDYIADAAEILRAHGEREPLWLAEAGYSSVGARTKVSDVYRSRWHGEHTDAAQAAALARMLLVALGTRQLSLVAWYRINDLEPAQEVIGDDNNRHLGIRRVSGESKPAAQAFVQIARLFEQPFRVADLPLTVVESHGANPVLRSFVLRDGRHAIAAWMSNAPASREAESGPPIRDSRRAVLRVELPREVRALVVTDATGRSPTNGGATAGTGDRSRQLTLEVRNGELVLCITQH
jgi:hypothetical protein